MPGPGLETTIRSDPGSGLPAAQSEKSWKSDLTTRKGIITFSRLNSERVFTVPSRPHAHHFPRPRGPLCRRPVMSQNTKTLLAVAAELRAVGSSWNSIGKAVHRKAETC